MDTLNEPTAKTEPDEFSRIVLETDDDYGRTRKRSFVGKWLVDNENYGFEGGRHGGGTFSVAVTKAGALVVIDHDHDGGIVSIETFSAFSEFVNEDSRPQSLYSAVASEIGEEYIEEMNI